MASYFGVFGSIDVNSAPSLQGSHHNQAPILNGVIADFDVSTPAWVRRTAHLDENSLTILDTSLEPHKNLSKHPISSIKKIGTPPYPLFK